jgi:voltage-gated potassium channel
MLVVGLSEHLSPYQIWLWTEIDITIALVFLADWIHGLIVNKNKRKYIKREWYMLLAAIPISGGVASALTSVRLLRIMHIVRIVARLRRVGEVAGKTFENFSEYFNMLLVLMIVVMTGAVAFFTMEVDVNQKLLTFFDAIWWAMVTITTVGYGDVAPVTVGGKIVAMALMLFGIGVIGYVAGVLGQSLIRSNRERSEQRVGTVGAVAVKANRKR